MKDKDVRRCACCKRVFVPDPRTRDRQRFCSDAKCRKASKTESQKRWLEKEENKDYWRGREHVERVRTWRKKNPRYWKRAGEQRDDALQDDCLLRDPLILGLIATVARSTLQEDIVAGISF